MDARFWMPPTTNDRKQTESSKVRNWNDLLLRHCLPWALVGVIMLQFCLWIRLQSVFHNSSTDFRGEKYLISASNHQHVPAAAKPLSSNLEQHDRLDAVVPKLGVLLDTGRHEFSVEWIQALIDFMEHLGLSILHVRLSDDQRLVDPTTSYWEQVVPYARDRSVQIMPELDVPSHALAWGDLAVACPKVACRTAFGIPLNVSHPKLWERLDGLLQWIIDVFQPEILHMGGDEIHVNGGKCIEEATGTSSTQDYEVFERSLGSLLQSKVLRWELAYQHNRPMYRYGNHTHYWTTMPITTLKNAFVSTNLYWDVLNRNDYEPDAFRVYTIGRRYRYQRAIIAGTFELNAELWEDRNVMGKLVALSLIRHEFNDRHDFELAYNATCREMLPEITCQRMGLPMIPNDKYRTKHAALWVSWKRNACHRTQGR